MDCARPAICKHRAGDCTAFSSSDSNVPVSLMAPPTLHSLRAEELMASPTDNSFTPLPARSSSKYVLTSKPQEIESSGRFWEVEEILRMRTVRGRGLHAGRVKEYLVQWAPSLLSVTELHYAQKIWKIVKMSQCVHAEKGEAFHKKIRVEWARSKAIIVKQGAGPGPSPTYDPLESEYLQYDLSHFLRIDIYAAWRTLSVGYGNRSLNCVTFDSL